MAPSVCGSFLPTKKALLAFTWTLVTLLTLLACIIAIIMTIQVNSHYAYLTRMAENSYGEGNENDEKDEGKEGEEHNSGDSGDNDEDIYQELIPLLASTSSQSMKFVAVYTTIISTSLVLYGSTAIVGFTSLQGVYIGPCFPRQGKLKVGIFGGAIVVFANLLMLIAMIFGEFRVEDYLDGQYKEDTEPYAVERIATILACTCMFLSILYGIFAILLFLAYASDQTADASHDRDPRSKPLNPRHHEFITMGTAS